MNLLTISKKTFEELLRALEWHIFLTKRVLQRKRLTAEEQELFELDVDYSKNLYERARDETGHVWSV